MGGFLEKLSARSSLPEQLFQGTARLTLTGGEQVLIENRKCLLSFAPDAIEVGCGKLRLRIRGSGLPTGGIHSRRRCRHKRFLLWPRPNAPFNRVEGG